jgi:transposase
VVDALSQHLVPNRLWALAEPLIPQFSPRPQGGGTTPVDDRAVFTAVVFVVTSGCAWRYLPPSFKVTVPTAHRRLTDWTAAGLWPRLHRAVLDELGSQGLIDWSRDRAGLPLSVAVSAANTNDAYALKPLVMAIPAIKSRRGPRRCKPAKLHADKAYDQADLRNWVRDRGIAVRIARTGIESGQKLGRHRWVIERSIAWLFGYHRLAIRYDRYANHFCAFLTLSATLTCYKKLVKAST